MVNSCLLTRAQKQIPSVIISIILIISLFLACAAPPAAPPSDGTAPPTVVPKGTLNLAGADPTTLDPALIGDAVSHRYAVQIFSGLVRLDDNLQPAGDIASKWAVSEDGTTYTFHLRNDVKFQDGRPVKAGDFKFSWERACTPELGSTTALTYLGDIAGAKDMLSGAATSLRGVIVIDDYTLQVIIDAPKSYFLSKLTFATAYVVDSNNVKLGRTWWQKPNGTGPFKLTQYSKQKQLVLTRNANYYGDKAKVNSVVFSILQGVPMDMYETGKIDVVYVGLSYIERALDKLGPFAGQLIQNPELSVYYIGFNSAQPPFDDVNVRLAFSYAIDKEKLISISFKNMEQNAYGFLPPGMPGFNEKLAGLNYDANKARDLLAGSKYGSAANLPPITLTTAGEGGAVSGTLEVIAYQWKQNLGVDVQLRGLEPERYTYNLRDELDQLYDFGWIADYPHPQNFLELLFHSGADYNYGRYSNADVDALLNKAGSARSFNESAALYQEAEEKLVNDAVALPLFFSKNYMLVKPYVHGYKPNALGFVMLNDVSVNNH